jgi:hypothetical protein
MNIYSPMAMGYLAFQVMEISETSQASTFILPESRENPGAFALLHQPAVGTRKSQVNFYEKNFMLGKLSATMCI